MLDKDMKNKNLGNTNPVKGGTNPSRENNREIRSNSDWVPKSYSTPDVVTKLTNSGDNPPKPRD